MARRPGRLVRRVVRGRPAVGPGQCGPRIRATKQGAPLARTLDCRGSGLGESGFTGAGGELPFARCGVGRGLVGPKTKGSSFGMSGRRTACRTPHERRVRIMEPEQLSGPANKWGVRAAGVGNGAGAGAASRLPSMGVLRLESKRLVSGGISSRVHQSRTSSLGG